MWHGGKHMRPWSRDRKSAIFSKGSTLKYFNESFMKTHAVGACIFSRQAKTSYVISHTAYSAASLLHMGCPNMSCSDYTCHHPCWTKASIHRLPYTAMLFHTHQGLQAGCCQRSYVLLVCPKPATQLLAVPYTATCVETWRRLPHVRERLFKASADHTCYF